MKVFRKIYKCGVCGTENEYVVGGSGFMRGYSDFDLKPSENLWAVGSGILECPNCHYANYKIDNPIEARFLNNLELWNNSEDFQNIIKKYSGNLRKILLVAQQYENTMNYLKAYKSYIEASWLAEDDEVPYFRDKACYYFTKEVLPKYVDDLLQIADIFRMGGYFQESTYLLNSIKEIVDETDENEFKILNAEIKFIENKDKERHNLSEIFEET